MTVRYDGKPIRPVKTWSYSALSVFEECPLRYYETKVLGYPDPPSPALLKGRKVHKAAEDYLKTPGAPLPKELSKFSRLAAQLKELNPYVELQMTFRNDWTPGQTGWFGNDAWLRAAWDAGVVYDDKHVDVVDWKGGKRYDSNDEQLELFALTAMIKFNAKTVETRLWYIDNGLEVTAQFDAKDKGALLSKWDAKAKKLMNNREWLPRPGSHCRFCPLNPANGGPCRAAA